MNSTLTTKQTVPHATPRPDYLKDVAVVAAEQQLSAITRYDGKNREPLEQFGRLYKQHGGPFLDVYTGSSSQERQRVEKEKMANVIYTDVIPQRLGHLIYLHGDGRVAAVTGEFLEYGQTAARQEMVVWKRPLVIHGNTSEEFVATVEQNTFEELSATNGSLADLLLKRGIDRSTAFRLWRTHGSLLKRTTTIDELRGVLTKDLRPQDPMQTLHELGI